MIEINEKNDKHETKTKPNRSDSGGYALTEASTHSEKVTKQKVQMINKEQESGNIHSTKILPPTIISKENRTKLVESYRTTKSNFNTSNNGGNSELCMRPRDTISRKNEKRQGEKSHGHSTGRHEQSF